jgi:hypothetical protein
MVEESMVLAGKASDPPMESVNEPPGKRMRGTRKTKMGRAEKCGRALLPLYICGPGKKFPPEPPS